MEVLLSQWMRICADDVSDIDAGRVEMNYVNGV